MTPLRAVVLLATLVLVAPSVQAATPFSATSLRFSGGSTVNGDGSAIFLVASDPGSTTWSITATSVVVERSYVDCRAVTPPLYQQPLTERCGDAVTGSEPTKTTLAYADVTITSGSMVQGSALLARGDITASHIVATTTALDAARVMDPRFDEQAPPTASNSPGESLNMFIHETMKGEFVNLTANGGSVAATGTMTVLVFGMDYHLSSPGGAYDGRTGHIERAKTGSYSEYTLERDLLKLTNAHVTLATPSPVIIASREATVTVHGAITAADSEGALSLPTLTPSAPGKWDGTATLDLTPSNGRLAAAPTLLAAAGAAHVTRAPEALAWILGVATLVALALVGVWMIRRRREPVDDLDLALLAMEERRWTDALPHLDRLVSRRPDDAVVLVDRALCLEEAGRLDDARAGYESALRIAPFSAEAHYYYARTLARLRMTTGAMAHLTRALSLDERLAELARGERAFAAFADHPSFIGLVN